MMRDPSHPGVTYAIDGIPVSVDSFMSAVESQFASRFDLLAATLRGSTRVVGTRTTTESFTARFSGQSSSGSDDMEAGIVRLGSWDAFAFSFTVTTQTPIYDSSSWSFSLFAGWQSNPQDTVLEHEMGHGKSPCPPTQEQLRRSPIVKRAIKEAFDKADKDAKDFPQIGWIEHGGWIVWNKRTNQLSVLHKEPRTILNSPSSEKYIDTSTQVWLNNPGAPPKGWEFVAAFHIHPDNYLDPDDVSDVPSANHLKAPGIVGLPNGDIVVYGSYNRGIVNGNLPPGCH
jgi:hypothetical protein